MGREIKFRAWYKPKEKMYTQSLESINLETKVLGVYTVDRGYRQLRLSDFELMQYTGLKDKNGKEIYEGDIIYIFDDEELGNGWGETVIYHRACFMAGDENLLVNVHFRSAVIGNIYENPELLGESDGL
ncbi:hypothetical protein J1P26_07335 [Neobacillus sp. MM2021_6]|uniref:YopX family protein n=1 Tax=Bacillaceae TaxID=186817 RepID=UPI00140DB2B2|nr:MULTISPECIES: YopX family protein [Bacillaceae]MBO0959545.1 hypothetical protein [Neobacillus sp. MM2021_6]NHC17157.1 hypothetical protein [Bacillus sp. MM2020_4]